jgi:hypothetical protein
VKTYVNRKGHPLWKNRLKEECAFPDGGIWVQDSTWSIKNGQISQIKLCYQEAIEEYIHVQKYSNSMILHLTRYVTMMVMVYCGAICLKRPSQVAIKRSQLSLS